MKRTLIATSLGAILTLGMMGSVVAGEPTTTSSKTTVTTEKTTSAETVTDGQITNMVKAELAKVDGLPAAQIMVSTNDDTVSLSGRLNTSAEKSKAVACAQGVKGVKRVDSSNLVVDEDSGE